YDHILFVYDRTSFDYMWNSTTLPWNREHSWPQHWLGVTASNGTVNAASDLFEVFPAGESTNGDRGDDGYGLYPHTGAPGVNGSYFYPGDTDRGDVARSQFYMAVRYGQGQGTNLSLVNGVPSIVGQMGDLNSLLHWN